MGKKSLEKVVASLEKTKTDEDQKAISEKRGASPCNKQEQKSNKSRLGFEEGLKTDKHQSRCCCLDDDAADGESLSDKIRARQSTLG
ncbi:hypothetical protein NC652_012108 [Populus alba x Populus x berolinensis]|nr:hypothetical protein NC652_012108 [Populus alba x Populus x berolinensis]